MEVTLVTELTEVIKCVVIATGVDWGPSRCSGGYMVWLVVW